MAAPKPWESTVPMSSQPLSASMQTINNGLAPTIEQPRMQGAAPPPPPRMIQQQQLQQQQQQLGLYGSSNYLNPYAFSPYQAGGFYNNYRLTPFGMSSNIPVSGFSQLAMDESRSAFSSIESVIQAFRSISFMLESTYTSVFSSFRAVTEVFDQFTRIRMQLSAIYPLVLLWRFLKYLYHRLLRILHLRQATQGTAEETWSAIYHGLQQARANVNASTASSPSSSSSSLLVALFFLVTFGTPMLMLKFLSSIIKRRQAASNWLEQDTNQAQVKALYDYTARNSDELSFTKGQTIYLAPLHLQSPNSHWFLGSVDRIHTGLFPANYAQPVRQTTPASIDLHPQMPFNSTETTATTVAPAPPPSSSTITNIPPSIFHTEEKPTLT